MSGFDEDRLDELPDEYEKAIEEYRTYKLRTCSETTVTTYLNRATNFCEYLYEMFDGHVPLSECDEIEHAEPFHAHLQQTKSDTNVKSHIVTIRDWFDRLNRVGYDVDQYIWYDIEEELPSSSKLRDRSASADGASTAEIGRALLNVEHPMWHAYFMLMLKLSMRVGAVANLLLGHVHLQDPDFYRVYDNLGIEFHNEIRNRPDTIFVDPDVEGTKRDVKGVLPVDGELKTALLRALAVRPTTPASLRADQQYFFTTLATNYGLQQSTSNVDAFFAEQFVEPHEFIPDEMTPHDCRHWATRKMKETKNFNTILVAYIQGDSSDDMQKHYDNLYPRYESRVRQEYIKHIPSFFEF